MISFLWNTFAVIGFAATVYWGIRIGLFAAVASGAIEWIARKVK